ncbi:MAG: hypothetical protein WBO35_03930 [Candidatus Saccharimonadales bacterium]
MLRKLKGVGSTYRLNERRRRRRLLRLIIGVSLSIIILGAIIGLVYVWYMGKTRPIEQASTAAPAAASQTVKAVPVDENAPVGVAVQMLTSPVKKGGNSSISIKTRPKAACSIQVTYSLTGDKDKVSNDGGLIPKNADEYGVVSWAWTVETSRPVGSWPVEVTCAYKAKWGYGKDMLQVID